MTMQVEAKTPRTGTRQRILDVAAHLFACKGYAGTSIRDISEELGVTKAALYYHFESKEDILTELLEHPVAAVREVLDAAGPLDTADARRQLLVDVIAAITDCSQDAVAVFKDPLVAPLIGQDLTVSGVTAQISMRLAAGLSGVGDPAQAKPEHVMKAVAAVAAGHEAIHAWHQIYQDKSSCTRQDIEAITDLAVAVLES